MTEPINLSRPLWQPTPNRVEQARLTQFSRWLNDQRGLSFADYDGLWQWSIADLNGFWQSIWDYHQVRSHSPYTKPLAEHRMPGAKWFPGATVNFAEHVFAQSRADRPALVYHTESGQRRQLSWADLRNQVAVLSTHLRHVGVKPGDRVVAFLPNCPETMIACLATMSIGAVWSVCAPDMGSISVLDRFAQIEPTVLIACNGYTYGGKQYERASLVAQLVEKLPTVRHVIELAHEAQLPSVKTAMQDAALTSRCQHHAWPVFAGEVLVTSPMPFEHPIWIVYSSGTTGLPKPIVHGHGGVLLEALVTHLMSDLGPSDEFLYLSSSGWIVWNLHLAGLLVGATLHLYDGNPAVPDLNRLWKLCADEGITSFGAGAAFHTNCMKAQISPKHQFDLSRLQTIGSTGSPLSPEAYAWLYDNVKTDVYLSVASGGTDFAGGFVTGNCTLPTYAGEMQARCLGHAVYAFDEQGQAVVDEVGELVCTEPVPSMPLYFWGDHDGKRYYDSYFDMYPAPAHAPRVIPWRHGDWLRITPRGGAIIYGRSDATINRHGIRMGTAELYRAVEGFAQVLDSMVVDLEYLGRESYMPLFVVLRQGFALDDELQTQIKNEIRDKLSARHVPNEIFSVPQIPRTITGKKLELPIKKILLGADPQKVSNPGAMANPESLDWYIDFAQRLVYRLTPNTRSST
jgi:acetoacetyl-CoA synthetase